MAAGKTPKPSPHPDEHESDRLRLQLERTQLQIEVSNVVVSKLGLKDLLIAISNLLKQFIHHDFASVVLYDDESRKLHLHALDRPAPAGVLAEGATFSMAAFFYIEASHTADMDMFCALAHDPLPSGLVMLNPITDYLKSKGFVTTEIGALIHGVDVQFQFPSDSLGEASIDDAVTYDLDGTPVRVMTPEYLVAHMLKTNRPKDRLRLIRFIEAQAFDPATVYEILSEHGLEDKYDILERLEKEVSK